MTIKNFKIIPSTELKPGDILVYGKPESYIGMALDGIVLEICSTRKILKYYTAGSKQVAVCPMFISDQFYILC